MPSQDPFKGWPSCAIAGALKAKRLLLLTDVAGVLDKDGKLLERLVDTPVLGVVYEAAGSAPGGLLADGATAADGRFSVRVNELVPKKVWRKRYEHLRNFEQINIGELTKGVQKSLEAMTNLTEKANLEKIGGQASVLLAEVRDTNRQLKTLFGSPELKSTLADTSKAAAGAREMIERFAAGSAMRVAGGR